ncbi:MAG: hypothetical protein JWL89_646 [Candidatus Saccharibacteria bacterium]|nr:hypothetical protein [Candidatus Saccharibacteria bacterium]
MESESQTKVAIAATLHCLTGCAIGEILGTVIGSALNWSNGATAMLGILLAFIFGYGLTTRPLLKHGIGLRQALGLALAADTLSILTMEIVDTLIILLVPGALAAGPTTGLFWASLAVALFIAFWVAVPVNRHLIARGKGHAVVHSIHN